jgi:integrase/recombinase XerD
MARQGKAKVLTPIEFKKALKATEFTRYPLRNQAILYAQFSMALRACEVRRLRVGDVLSPDGKLLDEINLLKTMTKGNKQRHVYLVNPKARKVISDYIQDLKSSYEEKGKIFRGEMPLFPSERGEHFHQTAMVRLITQIYKLAGIVGAKSHSARRTTITAWIDETGDIEAAAALAGHESLNTTKGYREKNPLRLKKVAAKGIF